MLLGADTRLSRRAPRAALLATLAYGGYSYFKGSTAPKAPKEKTAAGPDGKPSKQKRFKVDAK